MASDIKTSDDGKTYTFTLRDAKWSNGDPVTAQDFEYAWKWALDPKMNLNMLTSFIILKVLKLLTKGSKVSDVGIKAKDDKTLVVELEPNTVLY